MPVYIVEWPLREGQDREVSLVKCEPKQLADTLDMVGDPYGCRVSRLKSTFFLTAQVEGDCVDLDEQILSFVPEGFDANSHLMETMKDSHRGKGTISVRPSKDHLPPPMPPGGPTHDYFKQLWKKRLQKEGIIK